MSAPALVTGLKHCLGSFEGYAKAQVETPTPLERQLADARPT
jgi:hypothetical protein